MQGRLHCLGDPGRGGTAFEGTLQRSSAQGVGYILDDDAGRSDTRDMENTPTGWRAPLCHYHQMCYTAARAPVRCAMQGCLK